MSFKIPRLPYPQDRLFGFLFFIAFIIPLAFSLYNYESFEIIKYSLLAILTGAALIAHFKSSGRDDRQLRGNKFFYSTLALFWFWSLVASLFAWDKNYAFFGFYPRFTNGFIFYSLWSILVLLLGFTDRVQIKFLLKVLVLCSGLVAVWGLLQSVGVGFYLGLTTDFFNRGAVSFLGNPDFASMFVAALVPISAVFLYRSESLKSRVYYCLNIFFQLWSLIIFASRGALLALSVGLVLACLLALIYKKNGLRLFLLYFFIGVCLLGLGREFLNFARAGTAQTVLNLGTGDVNVQDRLAVWKLSWQSMLKRPVVGVGLGNFELMFEHDPTGKIIESGFFDDAHNLALQLGVSGGFPLLLLFMLLPGLAVFYGFKDLAADFNPEMLGLIASIAVWLTASMFTPVPIPCYVLLAFLISACLRQNINFQRGLPRFKLAKTAGISLGIILVLYGCFFYTAEILFFKGIGSYNAGDYQRAYDYEKAATLLNPANRFYYVYLTGSAIRANFPLAKIQELMARTAKFDAKRSLSYSQEANLYYLLFYQTRNPAYEKNIIADLRKAIGLDPFFSGNYFLISQYELVFGNIGAAQQDAQQGLQINPQDFQGLALTAKIYQLENNQLAFIEALTVALRLQPDNLYLAQLLDSAKKNSNVAELPFEVNFSLGNLY